MCVIMLTNRDKKPPRIDGELNFKNTGYIIVEISIILQLKLYLSHLFFVSGPVARWTLTTPKRPNPEAGVIISCLRYPADRQDLQNMHSTTISVCHFRR